MVKHFVHRDFICDLEKVALSQAFLVFLVFRKKLWTNQSTIRETLLLELIGS